MSLLWSDLLRAARNLLRTPGFTLTALFSLALGIGANLAAFSIVNALLLRPTGVRDAGRLLLLNGRMPGADSLRFSWFDLDELARAQPALQPFARSHWPASLKGMWAPEVALAAGVSGNYFDVLGVPPRLGHAFQTREAEPLAVISHRFWQSQFLSRPEAVGEPVWINNQRFTIAGIAPPGFQGELVFMPIDAWVPLSMLDRLTPLPVDLRGRGSRYLDIGARLPAGVTVEQARDTLRSFCASMAARLPETHGGVECSCEAGTAIRFPQPGLARGLGLFLAALSVVVGLLLLIACSNVAHLLLVRAAGRQGEIAMRLALGSSRGRLVRYLLMESLLLGLAAAGVGILVHWFVLDLLGSFHAPSPLPVSLSFALDGRVFLFTLGVALASGLLFGLLPALHASRVDLSDVLREQTGGWLAGRRRGRWQTALVTGQVALSLVLVVAASLTLQSLRNALAFDPGFDVSRGIVAKFNLAYGNYQPEQIRAFQTEALRRVRSLPGVENASLSIFPPLDFSSNQTSIQVPGYPVRANERLVVDLNLVSSDYFAAMGIPLLRGRGIEARDVDPPAGVAVVNATMARRFWGREDPIGRGFIANGREHRVIGVAGDGKYFLLTEAPRPLVYLPMGGEPLAYFALHIRTSRPPETLLEGVAAGLRRLDPNLPAPQVRTLREHMRLSQYPATIAGVSIGLFGMLALVMALTGIYGVMARTVRMRTHELGIRAALGATGNAILKLVLARGLRILAAGLAIGVGLSLAANRLLAGLLVGIEPDDAPTLVAVAILLGAALLLACYIPANRAARRNVAECLRHE